MLDSLGAWGPLARKWERADWQGLPFWKVGKVTWRGPPRMDTEEQRRQSETGDFYLLRGGSASRFEPCAEIWVLLPGWSLERGMPFVRGVPLLSYLVTLFSESS